MLPSIQGLNTPIILFVGRPGDWKKGLPTLLAAVELLQETTVPPFSIWVVGGSELEVAAVRATIQSSSALRGLECRGGLIIWGRVEREALPELYSRATLLVIPSIREQFGIVAIEAMMCGCPVLASRTGGLVDIVVEGETGHTYLPGDVSALAFALSAAIRSPSYWHELGRKAHSWASAYFSQRSLFEKLRGLLAGAPSSLVDHMKHPNDVLSPKLDPELHLAVEGILGCPCSAIIPVSYHNNQLHRAFSMEGSFAVKRVSLRPAPYEAFFRGSDWLSPWNRLERLLAQHDFHHENPLLPQLRGFDCRSKVFVYDWVDGVPFDANLPSPVFQLAGRFQEHGRIPKDGHIEDLFAALRHLRQNRDWAALDEADRAAATLNSAVLGASSYFVRVHPWIELERCRLHLSHGLWPLPGDVQSSLLRGIEAHSDILEGIEGKPHICHGDWVTRHLIKSSKGARIVDIAETRFVSGPLDEAHWALIDYGEWGQSEVVDTDRIRNALLASPDAIMAKGWAAVQAIFRSLALAARGQNGYLPICGTFLTDVLR